MQENAKHLLEYLESHKEDRGVMADLRRGFSEATADRTWPYLASWCDLTNDRSRTIYQTVMASYAHHPHTADQGNMGTVLRQIALGAGGGQEGLKTFDARFRRLLICDTSTEVCQQIGRVIRAAAQKGVPINYTELFTDLWYWGERVKLRWASAYWGTSMEGGEA
jgi:CRISPR type I-E-associated protein CasB/Cse2